jgi:hypothetical protein
MNKRPDEFEDLLAQIREIESVLQDLLARVREMEAVVEKKLGRK